MAPLIVLIVLLGVFPKPVLDRITPSVNRLVVHVDQVTHTPVPAELRGRPVAAVRTPGSAAAAPRTTGRLPMTAFLASAAPTIHVPHVDYLSILPMLIMLGGALALMLVSSLPTHHGRPGRHRRGRRPCRWPRWWPPWSSGTTWPPTAPR